MAVSFSGSAKAEICRSLPQKRCCALAQCFGVLLFCNSFTSTSVRIITECHEFSASLPMLFKKAFGITFDVMPEKDAIGKLAFQIHNPDKIATIMHSCGFDPADTLSLHLNLAVLEDDCCKAAFLKGAFLAGGSVTDPEKGYHLELVTGNERKAFQIQTMIREFELDAKIIRLKKYFVVYLKEGSNIVDFLNICEAHVSLMQFENERIVKEMRNSINRRVNCETANISKTVNAATKQIADIEKIRDRYGFANLPENLKEMAEVRMEHPDTSLKELGQYLNPPVGKSGVNHRLRKLSEIAEQIQ